MTISDETILSNYYSLTKGLLANKSELIIENEQLNGLRDWLLPILMNGQAVME